MRHLPEEVQITVAGSLCVLQMLAQFADGIEVFTRFAVVARVTQIANQQMEFRAGHPDSTDRLALRPTTQGGF